jgi:hypothetical protein
VVDRQDDDRRPADQHDRPVEEMTGRLLGGGIRPALVSSVLADDWLRAQVEGGGLALAGIAATSAAPRDLRRTGAGVLGARGIEPTDACA